MVNKVTLRYSVKVYNRDGKLITISKFKFFESREKADKFVVRQTNTNSRFVCVESITE